MELTYTRHGDYFVPDLALSEATEARPIGLYGEQHANYLKAHRRILYTNLLTCGKLRSYLADINERATERLLTIMEQMKTVPGVTEEFKAKDMMAWVGAVNNIKSSAEEIVLKELIFQ